jgi:hypothetical protein
MAYHAKTTAAFTCLNSLFGRRSRLLATVLIFSALGGVAIPPKEIERQMQSISNAAIVQVLERRQVPPGGPPDGDEREPFEGDAIAAL